MSADSATFFTVNQDAIGRYKIADATAEAPTAHLRWIADVLEQKWEIRRYTGGTCSGIEYEWRPIERWEWP